MQPVPLEGKVTDDSVMESSVLSQGGREVVVVAGGKVEVVSKCVGGWLC